MKKQLMVAAITSGMLLTGCATDPYAGSNTNTTTNQNWQKAATGAVLGAVLGAGISKASGGDKTGRDAAIGALLGAGVGAYMQKQANAIEQQMAGTGVQVTLDPTTNKINIVMPSNITFDVSKHSVKPSFSNTLSQLSTTLGQYNQTTVIVKGHTDSSGSNSLNQTLSEKRAYAVASYLNNNGVVASRISTMGYGETTPVATNSTEAGKAKNRRVEIQVNAPTNMS